MIPSIRASRASACSLGDVRAEQPDQAGDLGAGHDRHEQRQHLVARARRTSPGPRPAPRRSPRGRGRAWSPRPPAACPPRRTRATGSAVTRSTGSLAAITNSAQSAARSPARSSPTKSAYPGVSIRLTLMPRWTSGATASAIERPWARSPGSKSETVVPSATVPARVSAPQRTSSVSSRVVLPTELGPDQHDVADLVGLAGLEILSAGCARSFSAMGTRCPADGRGGNPWPWVVVTCHGRKLTVVVPGGRAPRVPM